MKSQYVNPIYGRVTKRAAVINASMRGDFRLWPFASFTPPQCFGRDWGHSGHWVALAPAASVANDPTRHFAPSVAASRKTAFSHLVGDGEKAWQEH